MGPKPFDEGMIAGSSEMRETANPYAEGTDAHGEWEAGYHHAKETDDDGEAKDDE
jgi:hypothetical protein